MTAREDFLEVYELIVASWARAFQMVNRELISLYWNVGRYISQRTEEAQWGKGIVESLSLYLKSQEPDLKGFSARNMWRMKQFFEFYDQFPKLSPVVTEFEISKKWHLYQKSKSIPPPPPPPRPERPRLLFVCLPKR